MKIGDLVNNPNDRNYLRCGSGVYSYAVVMSVSPLILVSEETDMRWTTLKKEKLEVVGKAGSCVVKACLRRLTLAEQFIFFKECWVKEHEDI